MNQPLPHGHRLKGYVAVLASALCFGSYGVWSKLLGNDFGIYSQGWVRSAIILIILIPLGLWTKSFRRIDRQDWRLFIPTIVFTIFTVVPIFYAFNHLSLGTATLIFYSLFLLTTYIIGWTVMGEHMTVIKLIAFGLALIGMFITFGFSLAVFSVLALFLAAFNGVASGGEVAFSKLVTEKYSTIQVTTLSWFSIMVTHLIMALVTHESVAPVALNQAWLGMSAFSVVALAGFWLVIEGFKYIDASVGGLIGLTEIIFSIGFGLVLFHQPLTLSIVLGGSFILLAGVLPDLAGIFRRDKPAPLPSPL